MTRRRLRAPADDGGLLADPPPAAAPALLEANRNRLAAWDHDFQGRRAGRLRQQARAQAMAAARRHHERMGLDLPPALAPGVEPPARLVVTGHQPELFHPGVWVKNFAAAAEARAVGGLALNLIVDNDVPKDSAIRVPHRDGDRLTTVVVPFDRGQQADRPYEDLIVEDEVLLAGFAARARAALGDLVADPMLDDYWPRVVEGRDRTDRLGLRFANARRQVEASWGVFNAEAPLSALCEGEPFAWLAAHLLAHLPRYVAVHNARLVAYRRDHRIRSRHHPVPALATRGDWLEAPFWCWRASEPRRRPLMARQVGRDLQLRIDGEDSVLVELPLAADREACCAVDRLMELPGRGVRLRTRALTTTLFARLLVGDLFLHGIGGAKYDELGDAIAAEFFGIEPPPYQTLSMTSWLGLPGDDAAVDRLPAIERRLRDLDFNPERYLTGPLDDEAAELVAAKRRAIDGPQATRRERVGRFRELRRINDRLADRLGGAAEELEAERAALRTATARRSLARRRDYAAVLHSTDRLRARFRAATGRPLEKSERAGAWMGAAVAPTP